MKENDVQLSSRKRVERRERRTPKNVINCARQREGPRFQLVNTKQSQQASVKYENIPKIKLLANQRNTPEHEMNYVYTIHYLHDEREIDDKNV